MQRPSNYRRRSAGAVGFMSDNEAQILKDKMIHRQSRSIQHSGYVWWYSAKNVNQTAQSNSQLVFNCQKPHRLTLWFNTLCMSSIIIASGRPPGKSKKWHHALEIYFGPVFQVSCSLSKTLVCKAFKINSILHNVKNLSYSY